MTKANETYACYKSPEEAIEDRKLFVRNLGELLSQTREEVVGCELNDDDIVTVTFRGGHTKLANVRMDSYAAIIIDVMKQTL